MWFSAIVIVLVFTAGTALMMWLGEQINKDGIGNGISILLFAGIVAQLPATISTLGQYWNLGSEGQTVLLPRSVLDSHLRWCYLGYHLMRTAKEGPDSVRKACCRQKDVRRTVKPPSHQGCSRRRSPHHFCKLNSFTRYNQPLPSD